MRLQVIIVKVARNDKELMRELWRVPAHLEKVQKNNYVVLGSVSGNGYLSLAQVSRFYLNKGLVENPLKAFYQVMRVFIESKKIRSGEIVDLAVYNDFQRLGLGLKKLFTGDWKKTEEVKKNGVSEQAN